MYFDPINIIRYAGVTIFHTDTNSLGLFWEKKLRETYLKHCLPDSCLDGFISVIPVVIKER
jgi:hypothetical protein